MKQNSKKANTLRRRILVRGMCIVFAIMVFFAVAWLFVLGPFAPTTHTTPQGTLQMHGGLADIQGTAKEDDQSSESTGTDVEQTEDMLAGNRISGSKDSGQKGGQRGGKHYEIDTSCPIDLPRPHGSVSYHRGMNIETWKTQARSSCTDYARAILHTLFDAGTTLTEAGYLDLFGNHWGCVVQTPDEVALTVTIQTLSPSDREDQLLEITVVRTLPPGFLTEEMLS